jgi:multidrug transporter EmrE-like cation transporter
MLLVLVASFIGSFGAVFLKAGAGRLRGSIRHLIFNHRLAFGVTLFLVSTLVYLRGIRQGELSILYPMVSLGYVWTLFWSRLFFKEPLTGTKFMGLGLILVGIVFLGLGTR